MNIKHAIRYKGNDGNQYVRNKALYLTVEGADRESALLFDSIIAANEFCRAINLTFPGLFVVESFEVASTPAPRYVVERSNSFSLDEARCWVVKDTQTGLVCLVGGASHLREEAEAWAARLNARAE